MKTGASLFGRGFLAMLPLWAGAIPLGMAYGVAARSAGLSAGATQLMSLVVFSAAAQLSAVSLLAARAPAALLVATALAVNAQLLLLGLAVGRQTLPSWVSRFVTAWFLTDGAYGIAVAGGRLRLPTLLGTGVSMYVAWNVGTALGAAAGDTLPEPRWLGVDFVAPLAFLAVLVPLVRTRSALVVALSSATAALMLTRIGSSGLAVLGASLVGCAAGGWWTLHHGTPLPTGRCPCLGGRGVEEQASLPVRSDPGDERPAT